MDKKIRVGIIGQGRSGRNIHVAALRRPLMREKFEIAAVTDLIPERCNETKAEFPACTVYPDYKAMLQDKSLELIVNASFSYMHVPISIEALKAGFHVLSEKPLAGCVADVDAVGAAAKEAGRVFAVFQEARFDSTFNKVMEICNSGVLGRIVMARFTRNNFARRWDWQTLREYTGGAFLNTGSHSLDQALKLFGDVMPDKMLCSIQRVNSFGTAEDHIKLLFTKPGHPTIDYEVTSCAVFSPPRYQIYGEFGGLTANPGTIEWKYYKPEEAAPQHLIKEPLPERKYCSEKLEWFENSWKDTGSRGADWMGEKLYMNLYDAIRNGAPLVVRLEDVRRQIAIIEECIKQYENENKK
ncbi:MAG: Gfo/Idh/MocA family oxidoreductase [Victivallales bacterium]|nr:Gfo/Idh/MocA family oxidoreductase [Victivallales bacterium]